ncbi:pentatricopeptide repeat-containing protein At2g29760, chloroplastic-like [Fagus crenata]
MLRLGLFFDPFSASKLITASALSPFSSLDYARQVFDQIPQPNLYTWNILIRAYASSSDPTQSFVLFLQLLHQCELFPDKFTFPFMIKAASELKAFLVGRVFHGMAIKASLGSDIFIQNSLVHFYGSCGDLDLAYGVFVKTPQKDVVSWNSMIKAFAQGGLPEESLELFRGMEKENVKPNDVTMVGVLSACTKKLDLEFGRWSGKPKEALVAFRELQLSKDAKPDEVTLVCALSASAQLGAMDLGRWIDVYIKKHGIKLNCHLTTSLIDMYAKCGDLEKALERFLKMVGSRLTRALRAVHGVQKTSN